MCVSLGKGTSVHTTHSAERDQTKAASRGEKQFSVDDCDQMHVLCIACMLPQTLIIQMTMQTVGVIQKCEYQSLGKARIWRFH